LFSFKEERLFRPQAICAYIVLVCGLIVSLWVRYFFSSLSSKGIYELTSQIIVPISLTSFRLFFALWPLLLAGKYASTEAALKTQSHQERKTALLMALFCLLLQILSYVLLNRWYAFIEVQPMMKYFLIVQLLLSCLIPFFLVSLVKGSLVPSVIILGY
jgi:hypothetical protein